MSQGATASPSLPASAANLVDAPRSEIAAYLRVRYEDREVSIRELVAEYGGSYGRVLRVHPRAADRVGRDAAPAWRR